MPKTKQQWEEEWKNASMFSTHSNDIKAIVLLKKYCGIHQFGGTAIAQAERMVKFKNTSHGAQVAKVLNSGYLNPSSHKQNYSLRKLLEEIAETVGQLKNPKGDLAIIMEIIKEKTGEDYQQILAQVSEKKQEAEKQASPRRG